MRFRPTILVIILVLTGNSLAFNSLAFGQIPAFPWGSSSTCDVTPAIHLAPPQVPVQILSAPAYPSLTQQLAPKPTYNYGWFGSSPIPTWTRHFGINRGYTQWTQR
ncbi:MAG: hypothetical protein KDB03_10545 [Planctomycetales bacterium]|nr:hypothetical protein [Planctomycetales bacterium]